MGSSQSKDLKIIPDSAPIRENNDDVDRAESMDNNDDNNKLSMASSPSIIQLHSTNKQRSGMELVNYQCRKDKRSYNKCVKEWYTKSFITGNTQSLNQEDACGDLFDTYRICVLRGIRREFWDKEGLPPPNENSPLAEVDTTNEPRN